jgi:hypothetical protein
MSEHIKFDADENNKNSTLHRHFYNSHHYLDHNRLKFTNPKLP